MANESVAKITITGVEPYDGDHDFDPNHLTNRDLRTIKRISGLRLREINEGMRAGDSDLYIALAVICLQREGKLVDEDLFLDAEAGAIRYEELDDQEEQDDAGPPAQPSGDASSSAADVKSDSSGLSGISGSDFPLANVPSVTGQGSSAPSVTSGQATSET